MAKALDGKCVTVSGSAFQTCFHSLLLPVNETGATKPADVLATRASEFDAVLLMGLENGAKGLKLETVGFNALGASPKKKALPFGPEYMPVTIDLGRMQIPGLLELARGEIWSRDAGTFFCNEVLYRTMHAIRTTPLYLPFHLDVRTVL